MEKRGVKEHKGEDESVYYRHFCLTKTGESINILEYMTQIAAKQSTHVILFKDGLGDTVGKPWQPEYVDPNSEFQEFVAQNRPGYSRVLYSAVVDLESLFRHFNELTKTQHTFLMPYVFEGV